MSSITEWELLFEQQRMEERKQKLAKNDQQHTKKQKDAEIERELQRFKLTNQKKRPKVKKCCSPLTLQPKKWPHKKEAIS